MVVLLISFIVVILDQLTKYLARIYLPYTKNYGAAFGILQNYTLFLIVISIIVIIAILYYSKKYNFYSLGFVLGGTLGNLIDRIYFGYVTDFIDLGFWPSFNLADTFNTLGVIVLIIYFWKD